MTRSDRIAFAKLLAATMMAYGKPMPTGELAKFWWEQLSPFSLATVESAMAGYRLEERNFAPIPNAIIVRCLEADGRPSADEAWAIALQSCDEVATVIWTEETSAALADCRSILNAGDKIGARRAFIESYTRAVLSARSWHLPAKWFASLGTDAEQRQLALTSAIDSNKIKPNKAYALPSPEPKPLLLPGVSVEAELERRRQNLARVKQMIATLEPPEAKLSRLRQQRQRERHEADRKSKEKVARLVAQFTGEEGVNESVCTNRETASAGH
jgi:hypothetical protein